MTPPAFIYFDLGNVVLNFSHERACAQMAAVAGVPVEDVRRFAFNSPMAIDYERGAITTCDFYDFFCEQTQTTPDYDQLIAAGSDIFSLNTPLLAIIAQLRQRGFRIGILSNTCEMHWQFASSGRFHILPNLFDVIVLSYKIGAAKPDHKIYAAAAELAGVPASEIFYTDDNAGHVMAARAAGFDGETFTSSRKLVADLNQRHVGLTI